MHVIDPKNRRLIIKDWNFLVTEFITVAYYHTMQEKQIRNVKLQRNGATRRGAVTRCYKKQETKRVNTVKRRRRRRRRK